MKLILAALLLLQFGQRPPLAPAETLLEPAVLRAIQAQAPSPDQPVTLAGTDASGEIVLSCQPGQCSVAERAARKLNALVSSKALAQPTRTIRLTSSSSWDGFERTTALIHVAELPDRPFQILRGLWATAGIGDEVVEIFSRHGGAVAELRPFEDVGQLRMEDRVPITTIVANPSMPNDHAAFVAAASAYFLATLPNTGAEALLSHLTVGAHARLAEDGRRAVAQMGNQQRASADVLIMFGHAIEREQRRMRSFERFMPQPVDPMLRSRIADMEKGITSVWTSMGITSSPFVPAAERIRGRGGDDRRVPASTGKAADMHPAVAVEIASRPDARAIRAEMSNFADGKRSLSDIRDALAAEFASISLRSVVEYFESLAKFDVYRLR